MARYVVRQIVRVLVVIRVEAEDEQDAFEQADNQLPTFLPADNENTWVLGVQDESDHVELDTGKSTEDIGWEILDD